MPQQRATAAGIASVLGCSWTHVLRWNSWPRGHGYGCVVHRSRTAGGDCLEIGWLPAEPGSGHENDPEMLAHFQFAQVVLFDELRLTLSFRSIGLRGNGPGDGVRRYAQLARGDVILPPFLAGDVQAVVRGQ